MFTVCWDGRDATASVALGGCNRSTCNSTGRYDVAERTKSLVFCRPLEPAARRDRYVAAPGDRVGLPFMVVRVLGQDSARTRKRSRPGRAAGGRRARLARPGRAE